MAKKELEAWEIASFYKGAHEPANNSAEAQMIVKINASDFEKILAELVRKKRPSDSELDERREKLESVVGPLVRFLAEEYHPHHVCVVTCQGYELSEGIMCSQIPDIPA